MSKNISMWPPHYDICIKEMNIDDGSGLKAMFSSVICYQFQSQIKRKLIKTGIKTVEKQGGKFQWL